MRKKLTRPCFDASHISNCDWQGGNVFQTVTNVKVNAIRAPLLIYSVFKKLKNIAQEMFKYEVQSNK